MFNLLHDIKFACLDTETTGLSPVAGGKICEVAVSVTQGGKTIEEFSTLINPGGPIHPEVVAIHGINTKMVADAPKFEEVVPRLIALLDGTTIVAHNADFDMSFLRAEFEACGLRMPDYPVIDTLKFARKNGSFTKNNLGIIAAELGIENSGWHRAMADVKMTEQIFYYFLKKFMEKGACTLEDLQKCQLRKVADLPNPANKIQFI